MRHIRKPWWQLGGCCLFRSSGSSQGRIMGDSHGPSSPPQPLCCSEHFTVSAGTLLLPFIFFAGLLARVGSWKVFSVWVAFDFCRTYRDVFRRGYETGLKTSRVSWPRKSSPERLLTVLIFATYIWWWAAKQHYVLFKPWAEDPHTVDGWKPTFCPSLEVIKIQMIQSMYSLCVYYQTFLHQ